MPMRTMTTGTTTSRSLPSNGCRAVAHSNIAFAKYWGKRDADENLPDVPSLSLTLAALSTDTHVRFDPELPEDEVALNGAPAEGASRAKVVALLDRVRAAAGLTCFARVASRNDFPTASGLASSASGFAALAVATLGAAGLSWSSAEVSALARRSSVSAARSVFGGFVTLDAGARSAQPLDAGPTAASLRMLIAVTQTGPKEVGSTQGMLLTQRTSPFYPGWRSAAPEIFGELRAALLAGELDRVGQAMERSALAMHASMFAATPALIYLSPTTLAAMACVRELRANGRFAYFTMDAGPHVKVLTLADQIDAVRSALETVPGVLRVMVSGIGGGARIVEEA
jgi:diphosphomevalonate decarboxylase